MNTLYVICEKTLAVVAGFSVFILTLITLFSVLPSGERFLALWVPPLAGGTVTGWLASSHAVSLALLLLLPLLPVVLLFSFLATAFSYAAAPVTKYFALITTLLIWGVCLAVGGILGEKLRRKFP